MENNEIRSLLNEIQGLREEFRQVACFISELKRDYSVLEEKIELNMSDVLHLLGISKASLARWRELIPFPTDMYRAIMWFIHLRGYILLSRAAGLINLFLYTGKVCLCTTNCRLYHKDPCPERGNELLQSRN